MKLSRININVGAAVTSNVKEAETAVEENIGKIVGELLSRLEAETKGDPFELRDRTNAMLESIRTGNGIGLNTAAPAPATAPVLGATGSSPTSEEERLGTVLLHDILGGDQTAGDPALDMLRQMAASKKTAVFAAHVLKGLPSSTFDTVDPNVVGDFVIALVRDVAAGADELLPSGMSYELKSVKEQRRVNGVLSSDRGTLLHELGVSTMADATTKIQALKGEQKARGDLERLLSDRSTLNPTSTESSLVFATRAIDSIEAQAPASTLDTLGTEVGLTRNAGETNFAFQGRVVGQLKTLTKAHRKLVQLANDNDVLRADGAPFQMSDDPSILIDELVSYQSGRMGPRLK